MNSATYSIETYTADGTHMDSDEWASKASAIDAVNTAVGMPAGSFAVVSRVDSTITEVYRKTYGAQA